MLNRTSSNASVPFWLAISASVLLVLSGFAFWPQYLSQLGNADRYTHSHAALGTCWLLLLVAQPLLIRYRVVRWHRVLGRLGIVAGAGFFVSGILVAHRGLARMTELELERDGYFVYLPLAMSLIFGVALLMGVVWRSVPQVHSRFMASTAVPLLDPLLARILHFYGPTLPSDFLYQVPAFVLATAVLLGLSASLPRGTKGSVAFQLFAASSVTVFLLYFVVRHTSVWFSFVIWFRSLPIT